MIERSELFAVPEGFPALPTYTASWRAIRLELSPGTGEWITSHIVCVDEDGFLVKQVIRPQLMRALFGSHHKHFQALLELVENSLSDFLLQDGKLSEWLPPIKGFAATKVRSTFAKHGRLNVMRTAAMQSTIFYDMEDSDSSSEPVAAEEDSRYWSTKVREQVTLTRPDLAPYFEQHGMLYSDTVRFGFLTAETAAHFSNLAPNSIAYSMRMARGKLQELRTGSKTLGLVKAKLVTGVPRADDIIWSDRQQNATLRAIKELQQESLEGGISLDLVHSIHEAADSVISLA